VITHWRAADSSVPGLDESSDSDDYVASTERPADVVQAADLLLTMDHQQVSVIAAGALSRQNTSSRERRRALTSPHWLRFAPKVPPVMICA
jgi:hypothetical protein